MAELLIRAGKNDAALMERVLQGRRDQRPHRVVVDAHVAAAEPRLAVAARNAGVPFLIDPQTHFLQDLQHPGDPWAQLPFAQAAKITPADLIRRGAAEALVEAAFAFQLAHDATALVMPYVHAAEADDGWAEAQLRIWQAAEAVLSASRLRLPTVAFVALGWRLLERPTWPRVLRPMLRQLQELQPTEMALAASRVDAGANPADRLAAFIATLRTLSKVAPVLAWQQGVLGEAAVAAGAAGYGCGIGCRERCDLRAAMAAHRKPSDRNGDPRPVYVEALRRSIPKRSVEALLRIPSIAGDLVCQEPACCPGGKRDLPNDVRPHAIAARLRSLDAVCTPAQAAWKWKHLSQIAASGLDVAGRINRLSGAGLNKVDDHALVAMFALAESRRQILRRRRAA